MKISVNIGNKSLCFRLESESRKSNYVGIGCSSSKLAEKYFKESYFDRIGLDEGVIYGRAG